MRRLLTPPWLAWHALTLVVTVVFFRLGLWQWHQAVASGSAQNMGYALQWPVFALFGVAVWWRVCRDAVRPRPADKPRAPRKPPRRPAPEPVPVTAVTDEEDPELAAYNRYLAELHEAAPTSGREGAR